MPTSAGKPPVCPECEGRGWVLVPDDGSGSAKPCVCRIEQIGPRRLAEAGLPERYRRCTFENFNVEVQDSAKRSALASALSVSRRYVDEFTAEGGLDTGLIFVGPPGVGKTHLAAAVLSELIRLNGVRGLFVDFTSLLHEIRSTFEPGSRQTKEAVLGPVQRADVLVLDELGAQKPSEWVTDILYLIMNARYAGRRPTIFTTNYELAPAAAEPSRVPGQQFDTSRARPRRPPLEHRIEASLVSRLFEMARPVEIEADDYRQAYAGAKLRI